MTIGKIQLKNPFFICSLYIDSPDYLADSIINDICLDLDILEEKRVTVKNGKSYIVVFVEYPKKEDRKFKRFLDILRFSMWIYNNDSYLTDCKEIFADEKNAEMFSGDWS